MLNILDLSKTNKLILATFAFFAMLALGGGRAHAATLNVTGGCTLGIAINSVNAGTNQSGCTAVGSYGSSDTITIPTGTTTLTADLPTITENVSIQGAGMSDTVVSGNTGQYRVFSSDDVTLAIKDLTITGFRQYGLMAVDTNLTAERIDVNGVGAAPISGDLQAFFVRNTTSGARSANITDLYIHDIEVQTNLLGALLINQNGGGTTTASIQNVTIANISNTISSGGGSIGVILSVGIWGSSFGDNGTLNTTASNITIHNVHSNTTIAAAFSSNAYSNGGDANVNTTLNNVTITDTDGILDNTTGVDSAAFYAVGIGIGAGTTATSHISVGNSLMANNISDGNSSNCTVGDFTSVVSGQGDTDVEVSSLGHNIFDDNSCASYFTESTDRHNISNLLATLGPLQNNGGNVPTRALLPGSPAINTGGSVLGVTTDARGVARPDTCPSVGAFQFEGAVCAATTTNAGTNAGAPNTGIGAVSLISVSIATLLGLSAIGYSIATKRN